VAARGSQSSGCLLQGCNNCFGHGLYRLAIMVNVHLLVCVEGDKEWQKSAKAKWLLVHIPSSLSMLAFDAALPSGQVAARPSANDKTLGAEQEEQEDDEEAEPPSAVKGKRKNNKGNRAAMQEEEEDDGEALQVL
jgi:hypothetical protein